MVTDTRSIMDRWGIVVDSVCGRSDRYRACRGGALECYWPHRGQLDQRHGSRRVRPSKRHGVRRHRWRQRDGSCCHRGRERSGSRCYRGPERHRHNGNRRLELQKRPVLLTRNTLQAWMALEGCFAVARPTAEASRTLNYTRAASPPKATPSRPANDLHRVRWMRPEQRCTDTWRLLAPQQRPRVKSTTKAHFLTSTIPAGSSASRSIWVKSPTRPPPLPHHIGPPPGASPLAGLAFYRDYPAARSAPPVHAQRALPEMQRPLLE